MSQGIQKLIINSPYSEPSKHWKYSLEQEEYILEEGRRPAGYFITEQGSNQYNDIGRFVELPEVNNIRARVGKWRSEDYPGVTGITKTLLKHWRNDEQRSFPFFFCQLDAIETLIWLVEAPDSEKVGIEIDQGDNQFKRICSKMATGTGKTTVMAMLIAWQVLNKTTYPQDKRFSKNVLIITPGLTVKNRLSVLNPSNPENYYDQFNVIPINLRDKFNQIKILIENWHNLSWESEESIKKRRSVDKRGALSDEAYVRQVLGDMANHNNILVINDEAHHAWKKNPEVKIKFDKEDKDLAKELEEQSTVWVGGLERINKSRGILCCYDFSATPFAPSGKRNTDAALFTWIVSDFGLNDAIESGLVKTPRMVSSDDGTPNSTTYKSKLYHIYGEESVKTDLSRPAAENEPLPDLVVEGYNLLSHDWDKVSKKWTELGSPVPPVMITVANRTHTAARIEYSFLKGLIGCNELCNSDYICKIDSKTLKKIENEEIHTELLDNPTMDSPLTKDQQVMLIREKVNTVGQVGKPGETLRNIISVGMLSEGWDAKTVTHIMGLRAFSSQLLCEQVIGRGLRRTSYDVDEGSGLFTTEYVNIFGVPFSFLPQESESDNPTIPIPQTQIHVRKDKEKYAIEWPNVIRTDVIMNDVLSLNIDELSPLKLDASETITRADLAPFFEDKIYSKMNETIDINSITDDEFRLQTTIFRAASILYDDEWIQKGTRHCLVGQLIKMIEEFIKSSKLQIVPESYADRKSPKFRVVVAFNISRIINHIRNHIKLTNSVESTLILDSNRPVRSTEDMPTWYTKKPCQLTEKSHISHCVYDSTFETSDAYVLEHNPFVEAWVKNDHIGFEIPYIFRGAHHIYRPDFLIRLTNGHNLIIETKGKMSEEVEIKFKALEEWVESVNRADKYGIWHCEFSFKETDLDSILEEYGSLEPVERWHVSRGCSVTGRVAKIKQPRGGYVNPNDLEEINLGPGSEELHPEINIHATLVGMTVDYLTRFMIGNPVEKAFKISIMGAKILKNQSTIDETEYIQELLTSITGLDDDSIISACQLTGFDVCYRAGIDKYKPIREIQPNSETIDNIRIMVKRSIEFFKKYGPVVIDGPTFDGAYTDLVTSGDGDFLTSDTIWDFKVSSYPPTKNHTLQLLMYYLMGQKSTINEFNSVTKLGIFNPKLNKIYSISIDEIEDTVIQEVNEKVIGY